MSERAAQLRAQADAIEAEDDAADAMNAALDIYRADPSDENKAVYREAVENLAALRQVARADRTGLTVIAEVN